MTFITLAFAGSSVAKSYKLKPGDLLRIEVIEDSSLNRNALVLPDGSIAFPMVGQVQAAGLTLHQMRQALADGLSPSFAQRPSLHVAVSSIARSKTPSSVIAAPQNEKKLMTVFGMGELAKPGRLQIPPGASLMQFLAQAGGTTPFAATKRVQVRRAATEGKAVIYRVNVKQLMRGNAEVFELAPGDVVIVPERKLFE